MACGDVGCEFVCPPPTSRLTLPQLSTDISQLVAVSRLLVDQADEQGFTEKGTRKSRIWLPRLGKHWLMKAPGKGRLVDDVGASNSAGKFRSSLE